MPPLTLIGATHRWIDKHQVAIHRCRWVEVLAPDDPVPKAPAWCPITNRTLQAGPGADLDQGSAEGVMENVNWGYVQLALVTLAFGGLQI